MKFCHLQVNAQNKKSVYRVNRPNSERETTYFLSYVGCVCVSIVMCGHGVGCVCVCVQTNDMRVERRLFRKEINASKGIKKGDGGCTSSV